MKPGDLNCVVSCTGKADWFEEKWSKERQERLVADVICVHKDWCAASVILTKDQEKSYRMNASFPYISLVKAKQVQWKELGYKILEARQNHDWALEHTTGVRTHHMVSTEIGIPRCPSCSFRS